MNRLSVLLAILTLAVGVRVGTDTAPATAAGDSTCSGGVIAAGTYDVLVIAGSCSITSGTVIVHGGLTVLPGASLAASNQAATLIVSGGVSIGTAGTFILGCATDPGLPHPCHDVGNRIGGGVQATGASMVQIHASRIDGGFRMQGGRGFFSVIEDNTINGNVTIASYTAFFLGVVRNRIHGTTTLTNNDERHDEIDVISNVIAGDLICSGNLPAPDNDVAEGDPPNQVTGQETGQCVGL